ncbi:FAD-binding oxidoreductase [Roseateles sp.]|uniref:FAD-binding oxidoreductase n=1 Tax=Roseateles sp. TaxID=1971397 RepID=UPI003D0EFDB9
MLLRQGWKARPLARRWRAPMAQAAGQDAGRAAALDWGPLRQRWQGRIFTAEEMAEAGLGKALAAGGRPLPLPAVCLRARSECDVRRALEFLQRHELPFALRSGGHCLADLSSHAELVLDLSELRRLAWDARGLQAGPGVSTAELSGFLTSRGQLLPSGNCPAVSLGGQALSGGFGLLGRRDGLVCDQVQAMRMVTAGGELLEVNAEQNRDLFWALRGAGAGQFGVVTELHLRTQAAQAMNVVHGCWPLAEAAALIALWQELAPGADPRVNLQLALLAGRAAGHGSDQPQIELFGAVLAEAAEVPALLAPWQRALGRLAETLCEWRLPAAAAASYLCGRLDRRCEPAWQADPPFPAHGYQFTRSGFFEQALSRAAIAGLIEQFAAGRPAAQQSELSFIPWAGAYAQDLGTPGSSFAHRQAHFMVRHTAVLGPSAQAADCERARAWADESRACLAPFGNGHVYQGFAEADLEDWGRAYYGAALPRLRAIKARHDPGLLFRHAQSIEPAAGPNEVVAQPW